MRIFLQKTSLKPAFHRCLVILVSISCLSAPLSAERLRISPEDLRLRVAVSEKLPASLRKELQSLAASTPLPIEVGVLQTEEILSREFVDRGWSEKRQDLVRYYFLVARLEQSYRFSDEFGRREKLLGQGIEKLNSYVKKLNPLIARAPYNNAKPVKLSDNKPFPLNEVKEGVDGELETLKAYPAPVQRLGRHNLQHLRTEASKEREILKKRRDELRDAERSFLAEVSLLGIELIKLRPNIESWVTPPGEGTPFTP